MKRDENNAEMGALLVRTSAEERTGLQNDFDITKGKTNDNRAIDDQISIESFKDDGTLELLRLSCEHPDVRCILLMSQFPSVTCQCTCPNDRQRL